MASVSDDHMTLERSQTLDQSVAGKDGEKSPTNGSPNHTDDDVLVATLVPPLPLLTAPQHRIDPLLVITYFLPLPYAYPRTALRICFITPLLARVPTSLPFIPQTPPFSFGIIPQTHNYICIINKSAAFFRNSLLAIAHFSVFRSPFPIPRLRFLRDSFKVSDPLEEVAENRRKKKRVILTADFNSNKKARLDSSQSDKSATNGKQKISGNSKDKESEANDEREGDVKLEPPPYTKVRTSASRLSHIPKSRLMKDFSCLDHYHRKRNNPSFDEIPICDCPKPPPGQIGCLNNCVNRYSFKFLFLAFFLGSEGNVFRSFPSLVYSASMLKFHSTSLR